MLHSNNTVTLYDKGSQKLTVVLNNEMNAKLLELYFDSLYKEVVVRNLYLVLCNI